MKINDLTSEQIKYCRVLCIYFMIIVHLPPWLETANIPLFFEPIKIIFYDILGRSSVTALSCISGFLIYFVIDKKSWTSIVESRFRNLIVPMAFWNSIAICYALVIFYTLGKTLPAFTAIQNASPPDIVFNAILGVNNKTASGTLSFLRDLFVCAVLAVPLGILIKRFSWGVILSLLAIYLLVSFEPVVMRGSILLAFAIGMVIAHHQGHLIISKQLRFGYLIGLVFVCLIEFDFLSPFYQYDLVKRAVLSMFFIDIAFFLSLQFSKGRVDKLAASTYLIYLSHDVAFLTLWGVWNLFVGNQITASYLIFYFLTPLLWFTTVSYSIKWLTVLPPLLQEVMKGNSNPKVFFKG